MCNDVINLIESIELSYRLYSIFYCCKKKSSRKVKPINCEQKNIHSTSVQQVTVVYCNVSVVTECLCLTERKSTCVSAKLFYISLNLKFQFHSEHDASSQKIKKTWGHRDHHGFIQWKCKLNQWSPIKEFVIMS